MAACLPAPALACPPPLQPIPWLCCCHGVVPPRRRRLGQRHPSPVLVALQWAPADRGACGLTGLGADLIRIVHFGHHTTPANFGPVGHVGHPDHGCFHPLKDVVAVPHDPNDHVFLAGIEKLPLEKLLQLKTRWVALGGWG